MTVATGKEDPARSFAVGDAPSSVGTSSDGGKLIVLTAPLTESIDHAGYFIQMALASLPQWLEFVLNQKYPQWRQVEHNDDGTARYMPAGDDEPKIDVYTPAAKVTPRGLCVETATIRVLGPMNLSRSSGKQATIWSA